LNREDDLGSIEEGKRADMAVLDRDFFAVIDAEMRDTLPTMTVVDGQIVHNTT
jgi:predicted amidohydrolase YtcJ